MFEAYRKEVLGAYKERKTSLKLPPNLVATTPSKIRQECSIVYQERRTTKDDEILRLFFSAKHNDYTKVIEQYKIDGFKQLVKVLNGKEIKIGEKYIELLAWLINFEPRPYQLKDAYQVSVDPQKILKIDSAESEVKKEDFILNNGHIETISKVIIDGKKRNFVGIPNKFNQAILATVSAIIASLIFYMVAKPKYMYWTGEHYETMAFYRKIGNRLVLEIDPYKLNHLKKITQPDTITQNALGKVWYVKLNVDHVEFYTSSGAYPIDTTKILKPLTEYIISKYVSKKNSL